MLPFDYQKADSSFVDALTKVKLIKSKEQKLYSLKIPDSFDRFVPKEMAHEHCLQLEFLQTITDPELRRKEVEEYAAFFYELALSIEVKSMEKYIQKKSNSEFIDEFVNETTNLIDSILSGQKEFVSYLDKQFISGTCVPNRSVVVKILFYVSKVPYTRMAEWLIHVINESAPEDLQNYGSAERVVGFLMSNSKSSLWFKIEPMGLQYNFADQN